MATLAEKFDFAGNYELEGEEREEYIAGLSPRAKILFEAYEPEEETIVEKVVKAAKKTRKRKKK